MINGISADELKKSLRKIAQATHPDKGEGSNVVAFAEAMKWIDLLREATKSEPEPEPSIVVMPEEIHFPDEGIPPGWYKAAIFRSEMKPTYSGTGSYLELVFVILEGEHRGALLVERLNLRNTNPVAQEIAYRQLSAIAHAVGIMAVQDSSQLHYLPLFIKVKVRKDSGENAIVNYRSVAQHEMSV